MRRGTGSTLLAAAAALLAAPAAAQYADFWLPGNVGSREKVDVGFFWGGAILYIEAFGTVDLTGTSILVVDPNGVPQEPVPPPYDYANPGATNYPTVSGGDGVNHFPGGGLNVDAPAQAFAFAGELTTDTQDPRAIRFGTLVGTFALWPSRTDWFRLGSETCIMIPAEGAHLYLAINDSDNFDNEAGYRIRIGPLPEPGAGCLLLALGVSSVAFVARRRGRAPRA